MPKKQPQPFFRKSTQSWYVQLNGKQIPLGKDRDKALAQYHTMMLGRQPISTDISVQQVIRMFLTWCEGHREVRTYEWYRDNLKRFRAYIGPTLTVANLKAHRAVHRFDVQYAGKCSNNRNEAVAILTQLALKPPTLKSQIPQYPDPAMRNGVDLIGSRSLTSRMIAARWMLIAPAAR